MSERVGAAEQGSQVVGMPGESDEEVTCRHTANGLAECCHETAGQRRGVGERHRCRPRDAEARDARAGSMIGIDEGDVTKPGRGPTRYVNVEHYLRTAYESNRVDCDPRSRERGTSAGCEARARDGQALSRETLPSL